MFYGIGGVNVNIMLFSKFAHKYVFGHFIDLFGLSASMIMFTAIVPAHAHKHVNLYTKQYMHMRQIRGPHILKSFHGNRGQGVWNDSRK